MVHWFIITSLMFFYWMIKNRKAAQKYISQLGLTVTSYADALWARHAIFPPPLTSAERSSHFRSQRLANHSFSSSLWKTGL